MEDSYDEYFMKQLEYMDSNPYESVKFDNEPTATTYDRTRSQTRTTADRHAEHAKAQHAEHAKAQHAEHEKAQHAEHAKAQHAEHAKAQHAEHAKADTETVDIKRPTAGHAEKFTSGDNLTSSASIKNYFFLFILFLFVCSDFFINSVLSGSALQGRTPTSCGVVIQGVVMVVIFAVFNHLSAKNII